VAAAREVSAPKVLLAMAAVRELITDATSTQLAHHTSIEEERK
jgi:hypothetical protein